MTPEAALEKQIARYRVMTREERVAIALRLHELACEMARLDIRRQYPLATANVVSRRRISRAPESLVLSVFLTGHRGASQLLPLH